MITVNLDKAKDIVKDKLRLEREPVLISLDVQFQRAMETGANTSIIVAKKQELRDITKHSSINLAETTDELKTALDTLVNHIKAE